MMADTKVLIAQSTITAAISNLGAIKNAIVQKGVPVPPGTPTSQYPSKILSIPSNGGGGGINEAEGFIEPNQMDIQYGYFAYPLLEYEVGQSEDYMPGIVVENIGFKPAVITCAFLVNERGYENLLPALYCDLRNTRFYYPYCTTTQYIEHENRYSEAYMKMYIVEENDSTTPDYGWGMAVVGDGWFYMPMPEGIQESYGIQWRTWG